ncbi:SET and MYND domain-containing protein 4-like protein [Dinothrombium tinctorium]|uniref:SET and MYND domain-containing protein 4-like protein n=1 Tax=Dinothrombium tinctorium TaxID=1965070 RepID=A0A443RD63_9ACAR|nr:SET and MYND domain-containing protein 4-like protein [Dinothrombium tinctorium]
MFEGSNDFNYFQEHCNAVINEAFKNNTRKEKRRFKRRVLREERVEDRIERLDQNQNLRSQLEAWRRNFKRSKAKSRTLAFEKLNEARQLLNEKKLDDALEAYSQTILLLPFPDESKDDTDSSDLWVHCFVQRAVLYFQMKQFLNCVFDLEQAIKHTLDNSLKVLLLCYRFYCIKMSKSESENQVKIELQSENDLLDGASAFVNLKDTSNKGRVIVANRNLPIGSLVVSQPAFVSWLRPIYYDQYCNHCLHLLNKRCIPCRKCADVRYCSWNCSENAWNEYHKYECSHVPTIKNLVFGTMALRTMIKLGTDNVMNYLSHSKPSDWEKTKLGDNLPTIFSLVSEMQTKDNDFEFEITIGAMIMAAVAEEMRIIKRSNANYYSFCSLLRKFILQTLLNCFYIYEESIKQSDFGILAVESDYKDIGFGIYSTASMFSHSCDCNANRVFVGSHIHIHTNREIKANEEITIDYGADVYHNSYKYRSTFLKNSFGFYCQCDSCSDKLENIHFALRCPICEGLVILDKLNENDTSNYCMTCEAQNVNVKPLLENISSADSYLKKSEKHIHKSNVSKAKGYLKKAIKIYDKCYVTDVALKDCHSLLSACYLNQKRYNRAFLHCLQALKLQEIVTSKNSFDYLHIYLNLMFIAAKESEEKRQILLEDNKLFVQDCFREISDIFQNLISREVKITNSLNLKYLSDIRQIANSFNFIDLPL